MDRSVIHEKLESLRRCVERIRSRCPEDASRLLSESPLPPPDTMGAAFDALAELGVLDDDRATRMKAAVGFRNIAVRAYQSIDWEIVHRLCRENLDDFRRYAASVEHAAEGK